MLGGSHSTVKILRDMRSYDTMQSSVLALTNGILMNATTGDTRTVFLLRLVVVHISLNNPAGAYFQLQEPSVALLKHLKVVYLSTFPHINATINKYCLALSRLTLILFLLFLFCCLRECEALAVPAQLLNRRLNCM